jgi:anthranilate phosphoribosyltransferase
VSEPASFSIQDAIARLAEGRSLDSAEARAAMAELLAGKATAAQIGAFLMGLRLKGETVDEITGLVRGMRDAGLKVKTSRPDVMDIVGTGGDGSGSFNLSTAAALVVAGAGVPVAKHGNRSASSRCGSADVLEALGVEIDLAPREAEKDLEEIGFTFLYARTYHPAMRHVAGARGELRLRTVFNILGPMTNPAGVKTLLLGVFDTGLRAVVARVLRSLGSERVCVVHGEGGLDEISIVGSTRVTSVSPAGDEELEVTPEDGGLERCSVEDIRGGDAQRNARIMESVLRGDAGPYRDAVLLNAAGALVVHGTAADLREGVQRARDAIDGGGALRLLDKVRGKG